MGTTRCSPLQGYFLVAVNKSLNIHVCICKLIKMCSSQSLKRAPVYVEHMWMPCGRFACGMRAVYADKLHTYICTNIYMCAKRCGRTDGGGGQGELKM